MRFSCSRLVGWLGCVCVLVSLAGCASRPYRYCGDLHTELDAGLQPGEPQIERGRRAPVIDTVGWVFGVPAKILMLDARVDNHQVSPEVEAAMQQYLVANGLDRVKVRVNEYDPGGEWRRLRENKSVGWPIRYSLGTISWVGYTLLPGRVFGGDHYNPYTNTISLYSDVPAIAVYEGGRAKDYAQREYKGLYAMAYIVPGVGLIVHDARATSDALGYLEQTAGTDQLKEGYRSIYPAYGIDGFGGLGSIGDVPLVVPAAVAGHIMGGAKAAALDPPRPPSMPNQDIQPAGYQAPAAAAPEVPAAQPGPVQ
jgi:hypothetical protein